MSLNLRLLNLIFFLNRPKVVWQMYPRGL